METKIKKGSVVTCASHAHKMTVHQINGSEIECIWFVGNQFHKNIFDIANLLKVEAEMENKENKIQQIVELLKGINYEDIQEILYEVKKHVKENATL